MLYKIINKKGVTFIELIIAAAVIAMSLLSLFLFNIKYANRAAYEDQKLYAFYNNVNAYNLIQKTLNNTGDIKLAIEDAVNQCNTKQEGYQVTLDIKLYEIVLCTSFNEIKKIDPLAQPIVLDHPSNIGVDKSLLKPDYYQAVTKVETEEYDVIIEGVKYKYSNKLYYEYGRSDVQEGISQSIPIYRVVINSYIGSQIWKDYAIDTFVSPDKGGMAYATLNKTP